MSTSDEISVESDDAQAGAASLAKAAQLIQEAWDRHRPAIEAAEATLRTATGDDAAQFWSEYEKNSGQFKAGYTKLIDAFNRVAQDGNTTVAAFVTHDQQNARQIAPR